MRFSWFVGLRYLTSRQKIHISFITTMAVVGVAIGVAALLVIDGISTGFLEAFKEKVLGVNAHVIVLKVGESFYEYEDVENHVLEDREVVSAAPFIITEMMIVKGKSIAGILVKGIEPEKAVKILDLPKNMISGSIFDLKYVETSSGNAERREERDEVLSILDDEVEVAHEDSNGNDAVEKPTSSSSSVQLPPIILGKTLAGKIRAKVGDRVRIISPISGIDTSFVKNPSIPGSVSAEFQVRGIFYSGFDEYDSRLAYINLKNAQQLFHYGDSVTGVEMAIREIDKSKEVKKRVRERLTGGLYRIIDWEELNRPLFTALFVQKIALTFVLMLSVLMASLNIISMLVLFIISKKKDISILKSMGASRSQIASIFMVVGIATGLIGFGIGSAVGFVVCKLLATYGWPLDPKVYLIDKLPLSLNFTDYVIFAVATFLICTIFTALPSLKAASLNPVEGIKYE